MPNKQFVKIDFHDSNGKAHFYLDISQVTAYLLNDQGEIIVVTRDGKRYSVEDKDEKWALQDAFGFAFPS